MRSVRSAHRRLAGLGVLPMMAFAFAFAFAFGFQGDPGPEDQESAGVRNVVLVHGAFVDGSGWEGVYRILKRDGFNVTVVQNPTLSLAGDVAATKLALADLNGAALLVGHSYGGVVATEAGN